MPLTFLLLALASGDGAVVEIQAAAKVRGARVQLQDVAVIKCDDPQLKARLQTLDLGPRPEGTWMRGIDIVQVRKAAELAGLPLDQLRLTGAERTTVQSLHALVRGEELAGTAEPALRALLIKWGESDVEMRAEPLPAELRVPPGRVGVELLAQPREATVSRAGAVVDVEVCVDGAAVRKVPVYLRLRRYREVLVAQAGIRGDQPFTRDNVTRRRTDVTTLAFEPITEEVLLQGKVAARALKAGQAITIEDVTSPPLVRRGEVVTLWSFAGRVRISTRAIAQRDGGQDVMIPVLSAASENKIVFARVEAPGIVVIGTKGK